MEETLILNSTETLSPEKKGDLKEYKYEDSNVLDWSEIPIKNSLNCKRSYHSCVVYEEK